MNNSAVKKPIKGGVARVPVVMQMEALECGAACLTMIMAYYGKWVPLEQVRVDCGVSRDGSNAKNVLAAARMYGLEAKGYKMELDVLQHEGEFPCIIHWDFNHFVVLDGFSGNEAVINDPARGLVKVPMEEFDMSFTGICLTFSPTSSFEKSGKKKSTLEFAAERLKGAGGAVAFVALATMITYMFNLVDPAFYRFFMDRLLTGENAELLEAFVVLFGFVGLMEIIVSAVSEIHMLKINGKMSVIGNGTFMWKVLRLPMEFFGQRLSGDILQRKNANATVAQVLVNTLSPIVLNAVMMVFYLVIMIRYSVLLTLIGVVSICINVFLGRYISSKRINVTRLSEKDKGKLADTTLSGIMMIETIKSSGAEDGFFEKWSGLQARVNEEEIEFSHINIVLGRLPVILNSLTGIFVLIISVGLVMRGEFLLGMLTSFSMYLTNFTAPAMLLIASGQTIQEMRTQMERIEDVMNYPSDAALDRKNKSADEAYSKLSGDVELRHVTFGYSKLSKPVIDDFSVTIKPGQKIAIVGASGCGKSTLSKLISGLYSPWSGEILFDGKDISEIDRNVFTGSVAVVDQDIVLFDDTIENNIKMWDQSIEDFEMILAARDAQIHDDIMDRPGGYKSQVEENGRNFSGGQRQRLEIARVLAQDPSIIIMDEATSALDANTEFELVNAVNARGITCIVIAHRLSTIRDCDNIIVLSEGVVVEQGSHDELIKLGGYYTELVTSE